MDESSGSALLDHVSGLEFIFKQIKHDLSCAANTLDDAFDEAVSSSASCAPHPMKLLRRLERIEAKASQLQTDWQELEERRKVVLPNVRNDIEAIQGLVENTKQTNRLNSIAGCSDPDYEEAAVTCLAHLGSADVLESNSLTENEPPNTSEAAAVSKGTGAAAVGASTSNVATTSKSGREAAAPPGPTRSNRPATGSSLELTPDAYHNLAESVRGKVPYEAAEKCYAAVEAACLAKNSKLMKGAMPDPVTVQDLYRAGAAVVGRSGNQTLNSLKILGLITVEAAGVRLTSALPKKRVKAAPR